MITHILSKHNIKKFIESRYLEEITFLDQKTYPRYNDGATYYKDADGTIFRIRLDGIYTKTKTKTETETENWKPVYLYIQIHIYSS